MEHFRGEAVQCHRQEVGTLPGVWAHLGVDVRTVGRNRYFGMGLFICLALVTICPKAHHLLHFSRDPRVNLNPTPEEHMMATAVDGATEEGLYLILRQQGDPLFQPKARQRQAFDPMDLPVRDHEQLQHLGGIEQR